MNINEKINNFFMLNASGRHHALEGVRAWAIIMVFWVHFFGAYSEKNYLVKNSYLHGLLATLHSGSIGVNLFFILSGFLIYVTIDKKQPSFFTFIKHRFLRLLPVHFVIIIPFILAFFGQTEKFDFKVFYSNLFFLCDINGVRNLNFVTWSLTYEFIFYLLAGVWFIYLNKLSIFKHTIFLVVLLIATLLLPLKVNVGFPSLASFSSFFWGVLIAKIYSNKKMWTKISSNLHWGIGAFGIVMIFLLRYYWGSGGVVNVYSSALNQSIYFTLINLGFSLLIVSLLTDSQSWLKKLFSLKILRILGVISYSFYLTHAIYGVRFSMYIANNYKDNFNKVVIHAIVAFLFTVIVSSFLFHYIEKPYLRQKQ